jgi:uncharacterized protein
MNTTVDRKRILIFLGFAFGIAWLTGLVVYLTGGITHSPMIIPAAKISLALVLIAVVYMWAPALAHILTRVITQEGWQDTHLRPKFREGWRFWLLAWVTPALLTIAGGAVFFAVAPQYFDPALTTVKNMLPPAQQTSSFLWFIVGAQILQALLLSPVINSLFTFGEEFGWRAYLLPKLLPLGERRAMLLMGGIWGVWHWPVIAMGHNYGLNYPGAPWLGMLAMVWFTFIIGTFLGWCTIRGKSVWPAVIGHAAVNGISGLGILFIQGQPSTLLGPMPTGIIASIPWSIVALFILLKPGMFDSKE